MIIDNQDYLTLAEYAKKIDKQAAIVRQKCIRGTMPGARKIGRDWFIPADANYTDERLKSGNYIGWRKKKEIKKFPSVQPGKLRNRISSAL